MHPSTLQNTLLIFLRHFLMELTRLYTEKEKARLLSEIQHSELECLVFLLACETMPFDPPQREDVPFLSLDKSELHFIGI